MNSFIIYKAENIENGWVYIGSTTSTIEKRKRDHIQKANNGTGHEFQEAITTYGIESFTWEQIDTAINNNELAEKEKSYILEYNAQDKGYNQDAGGGFKKSVYQYGVEDGKFITEYNCLEDAANAVSANRSSISAACLRKIIICKGFYWNYELLDVYKPESDKRTKQVSQFDINGNIINKFSSISEASNKTSINKSCIAKCCRNKRKSAGGFLWKFK